MFCGLVYFCVLCVFLVLIWVLLRSQVLDTERFSHILHGMVHCQISIICVILDWHDSEALPVQVWLNVIYDILGSNFLAWPHGILIPKSPLQWSDTSWWHGTSNHHSLWKPEVTRRLCFFTLPTIVISKSSQDCVNWILRIFSFWYFQIMACWFSRASSHNHWD